MLNANNIKIVIQASVSAVVFTLMFYSRKVAGRRIYSTAYVCVCFWHRSTKEAVNIRSVEVASVYCFYKVTELNTHCTCSSVLQAPVARSVIHTYAEPKQTSTQQSKRHYFTKVQTPRKTVRV